jgi:hypothetical protein
MVILLALGLVVKIIKLLLVVENLIFHLEAKTLTSSRLACISGTQDIPWTEERGNRSISSANKFRRVRGCM